MEQIQASPEPFAAEVTVALEHIETLTREEACAIVRALNHIDCEPVFAFLALHVQLAYVLASPHRDSFLSVLRSWGANRMIDVALWKYWGNQYRARYRAGSAVSLADLKTLRDTVVADDLILARRSRSAESPAALQRMKQQADLRATIEVGDVIRWRFATWRAGQETECEVVSISSKHSLWYREPGRKTKHCLSLDRLNDPLFQILELRKKRAEADAERGSEGRS